jgi:hypothetical protein
MVAKEVMLPLIALSVSIALQSLSFPFGRACHDVTFACISLAGVRPAGTTWRAGRFRGSNSVHRVRSSRNSGRTYLVIFDRIFGFGERKELFQLASNGCGAQY